MSCLLGNRAAVSLALISTKDGVRARNAAMTDSFSSGSLEQVA